MRTVYVCINERFHPTKPSCAARGSRQLVEAISARIKQSGLSADVRELHCFGRCELGPNVRIAPGGAFFHGVDLDRVDEIVATLESELAGDSAASD